MFNFLKKKAEKENTEVKAAAQTQAAPEKKEKASGKKKQNTEKFITKVMEATGWDRETAVSKMKEAKAAVGISYKDYANNDFFNVAPENMKKDYEFILNKKERNKAKKEEDIRTVMEATGWDREKTVAEIKKVRDHYGITTRDYCKHEFYMVPESEYDNKYQEVLDRKERRKKNTEVKNDSSIRKIMDKTGWDYETAVANVTDAQKRTGCTYKEYLIYHFYELSVEEQGEVFVARESRKITAKYDVDKKLEGILYDNERTNELFSEYVKRPWCVNTKISAEDFKNKFKDSKRIIYKPLDGNRGKGVEAYNISEENADEVYNELITFPAGVVEQYVVQHPAMSTLSPASVNTLRIVTISSNTQQVTPDGKKMDIAYVALRIGGGTSIVDNFHSGGMVAAVDLETGKLATSAADMDGNVFEKHPMTGTVIKGFQVPHFQEAIDMVKKACTEKNIEGYLGWDVAITEEGPMLIELNVVPGVVLLSMPYVSERKGMKKVMEKYLEA